MFLEIMLILIILIIIIIGIIFFVNIFIKSKIFLSIIIPINRKYLRLKIIRIIILGNLNRVKEEFYYFQMYICDKNFNGNILVDCMEVEEFRKKLIYKIDNNKYLSDFEIDILNEIIGLNYYIR